MRLPITWLKDYVDFDDSVEGLADKLTFSGTEVEAIETIGGDYTGLVVGEVREVNPHPNADKLKRCKVFDGNREHAVVCGAPVVDVGARYPFAPVGAVLPGGMKIKKAKIRGEVSEGMLCAEDELNLSDDHSGLMKLGDDVPVGAPLAEVLGPPETVLVVEITPNRPDCLSIIGMAREVAALYDAPMTRPDAVFEENGAPIADLTQVDVQDDACCPRYTARIIDDVRIGPSPEWMRKRLRLAGLRPINNIVDITNFVLLESGHPLHAFDRSRLTEGRIVVRRANPGETLHTLDDVDRKLDPDMLVIADAETPVAVAGVMGGAGSEIREGTTSVLLESACFLSSSVRHTSKRLGLSTDSSYRFSRGVSFSNAEWASRRATALIVQSAGGNVASGLIDCKTETPPPVTVECSAPSVNRLLGLTIGRAEIEEVCRRLELPVIETPDAETCRIEIPDFRLDLRREVDLIEEVARIHGLREIPTPSPRAEVSPAADDQPHRAAVEVCRLLTGMGFTEIMNYSLMAPADLAPYLTGDDRKTAIELPHPISQDQSVLRSTLLPQMTASLAHNRARQMKSAAFYEWGRVFRHSNEDAVVEDTRLSLGLMGPVGRSSLKEREPVTEEESFFRLKGALEALVRAVGAGDLRVKAAHAPWADDRWCAELLLDNAPWGMLGLLKKERAEAHRFGEPVALAECGVEPLITGIFRIEPVREVPVFPSIERDAALLIDRSIPIQDILDAVRNDAPEELEHVSVFDVFVGKGIPEDRKSVALAMIYRSRTKTLTDDEANRYHEQLKGRLISRYQADIR